MDPSPPTPPPPSPHPALARSATLRHLSASTTPSSLSAALSAFYLHGTFATASAATDALLSASPPLPLSQSAPLLRPLAAVAPAYAQPALARAAAHAAVHAASPAALAAFAAAPPPAVHAAIVAVAHILARLPSENIVDAVSSIRPFAAHVLTGQADPAFRLAAALVRIGHSAAADAVVRLLVDCALLSPRRAHGHSQHNSHSVAAFAAFVAEQAASLLSEVAPGTATFAVRAALLYALQTGDPAPLSAFSDRASGAYDAAVSATGSANVLYALAAVAAANASYGDLHLSHQALLLSGNLLRNMRAQTIDPAVASFARAAGVAIGALAGGGGSGQKGNLSSVELLAARLLRDLRDLQPAYSQHGSPPEREEDSDKVCDGLRALLADATDARCSRAAAYLAVLTTLRAVWASAPPHDAAAWLRDKFPSLLLQASQHERKPDLSMAALASSSARAEEENPEEEEDEEDDAWAAHVLPHFLALVCAAALFHDSPAARFAAVNAFAAVTPSSAAFFCFPVVLTALAAEENGAVAAHILHVGLASSESIIRDKQCARPLLATLLNILNASQAAVIRSDTETPDAAVEPSLHTACACIHALAVAASISPSIALPALLAQVNRVLNMRPSDHSPVDRLLNQLQCAAMSAAVHLISKRPSRGPAFVPLIQQCIATEAATASNPAAAALALRAMRGMASEGVLDTAKALKIVFRSHSHPLALPAPVRKAYLSLLGCASQCAESRKGRQITAKAIALLRDAIVLSSPLDKGEESLSWDEVEQAAASLAAFSVADILRIAFENDEEAGNADEERLRLVEIEKAVGEFVAAVARVAGACLADRGTDARGGNSHLGVLLQKIAAEEWAQRPRGQFDPVRIAKLRAASDALRRARAGRGGAATTSSGLHGGGGGGCGGNAGEENSERQVTEDFLHAVDKLPDGAIRSLSRVAGHILTCVRSEVRESDQPGEAAGAAAALRCLAFASALSPALPWARLLGRILLLAGASAVSTQTYCVSAAIRASYALPRDSFEVAALHKDMLGVTQMTRYARSLPSSVMCELVECLVVAKDAEKLSALSACLDDLPSAPIFAACVAKALERLLKAGECTEALVRSALQYVAASVVSACALMSSDVGCHGENVAIADVLSSMGACLVRGDDKSSIGDELLLMHGSISSWDREDLIRASCLALSGNLRALVPIVVEVAGSTRPSGTLSTRNGPLLAILQASLVTGVASMSERDRRHVLLRLVDSCSVPPSSHAVELLISALGISCLGSVVDTQKGRDASTGKIPILASGVSFFQGGQDESVFAAVYSLLNGFSVAK